MDQSDDRGGREAHILETDKDVEQHQDDRHDDREDRVVAHLGADRGGDIFRRDRSGVDAEVLAQGVCQLLSLIDRKGAGLDDDFRGADDLLHGDICVTGDIHDHRLDLVVELLKGVVLLEADRRGGTAEELHGEVQGALAGSRIDDHHDKTEGDHSAGDDLGDLLFADEVKTVGNQLVRPELRIADADRVDSKYDEAGNDAGREEREHNAEGEGHRKALDRAGAEHAEDGCGDKSRHVAVDDGGHGLGEAGPDRVQNRGTRRDLLADTGIDDDVRVNRHTDGEDDTGDTRKSQRQVKRVEQHQDQGCIEHQHEGRDDTRDQVGDDHDDADDGKTDRAADQGCADRVLAELGAYDIGADLI